MALQRRHIVFVFHKEMLLSVYNKHADVLKILYCDDTIAYKTKIFIYKTLQLEQPVCYGEVITLCPKSPSARGLVACLPVRLLFKSTKHNAFYPV